MDKISKFVIEFDGDGGDLLSVLGNIKGQVRSAAADIEQTTSRVELFKGVQEKTTELGKTFETLTKTAADFRQQIQQIEGTGTKAPKELTDALKATEKQIAATSKEYDKQSTLLAKVGAQLKSAGVDTSNLASEQTRLANALRLANDAETNRQAKAALGLRTLRDTTPEVQKLYAAYNTLSVSGSLSVKELAQAQDLLKAKVADLRGQVTGLGASAKAGGPDLAAMFTGSILPALGLTATVAGVIAGLKAAAESAHEFENGVARIGSVTNLTKEQLDELGKGAAVLARTLGVDVDEALKGVFDLIRSGVPADNALEVLRLSAIAAHAAFTDLSVGVQASDVLLSAFGVSVKDLGPALDKVVASASHGGPTLKEFADAAGPLGNVVRANNVDFDEAIAVLGVMTNSLHNAGEASTTLTRIIQQLNTSTVRDKLAELGITSNSLVGIFKQLADRGTDVEQVLNLGIGNTRASAAIAALLNNARALPDQFDLIAKSAGAAAKGSQDFFDSPKGRSARFDAELKAAENSIGAIVNSGGLLTRAGTAILHEFNQVPAAFRESSKAFDETHGSVLAAAAALLQLDPLAAEAERAQRKLAAATGETADKNDRLSASLSQSSAALRDLAPKLLADLQAIQAASARDIQDAQTRADAQIAALDRSAKATADTAVKTLAIQTKLAADRLAIIQKEEKDVTAAVDKAVAAREETARKAGESESKIALDSANARIAALSPILAQYQAHYNALVAQAQGYAAKIQSIDNERVSFNEGIEKILFDIRIAGLSAFDQYLAKVQEIEVLIAKAREAGAAEGGAIAKKYTDQAIALAGQLKSVTDANGVKVISDLQAQTQATDLVKKAAEGYNAALDKQAAAAKDGADATKKGIDEVLPKLQDLQANYDALKKTVEDGLDVRVNLDEKSVADAFATLDRLSADRHVRLIVDTVNPGGTPAPAPEPIPTGPSGEPLARGGLVGAWHVPQSFAMRAAAQYLRGGGPVFNRPAWDKVPGSGEGDTVPALLREGSFVVRKSASKHYGDATMRRLAKGFASGGPIKKLSGTPQNPDFGPPNPNEVYDPRLDPTSPQFDPSNPDFVGFVGDAQTAANAGITREGGPLGIDPPTLPTDPRELERKVLQYLDDVIRAARQNEPNIWGGVIAQAQKEQRIYEQRPTNANLMLLLARARDMGLNLRDPTGKLIGYDIDGRSWHATPLQNVPGGLLGGFGYDYEFYADGGEALRLPPRPYALGGGTDSVPAMLTPGEWVVNAPRVAQLGAGFMEAVNSMAVPREALAGMLGAPQPPRGYLNGGQVLNPGDTAGKVLTGGQSGANILEPKATGAAAALAGLTINVSSNQPIDATFVRREILPALNDILRRAGVKFAV